MNKGFTLIEVLVASFLICIFSVSFVFLVSAGIKQANASRQLTRSILLTKSIMEELRSKPFSGLFSYNNVKFDGDAGLITVVPVGTDLVSITIKHKVELATLRSRH